VIDSIELGRRLGNLPKLLIVGVEIMDETPFCEALSPQVAAAVIPASDRVLTELRKMLDL
jgi:Ni,Fe-hydrogenase maturation factor